MKSEMSNFDKAIIYQDDLPDLVSTKQKRIKISKIIVGSVIQYLKDYNEIARSLDNLFYVLKPGGAKMLTHNPDFGKKIHL